MAKPRTYLDWNATAPLRPEARAAMLAALDLVGNASSVHAEGRRARGVVETAREQVSQLVGARPEEVVFTGGATEANNWAIKAGWKALYIGATEHDSVLAPARMRRAELLELACDESGLVEIEMLPSRFPSPLVRPSQDPNDPPPPRGEGPGVRESWGSGTPAVVAPPHPRPSPRGGGGLYGSHHKGGGGANDRTGALLSLQLANAETGVIQPIADVVEAAHQAGMLAHCDAVQAVGRIPVDFRTLGLDLMSISAHKLGGPKGVGALVIRDGMELPPLLAGGGQERRRRAGTENVAAIAGFGAAAQAARDDIARAGAMCALRDRLEAAVREITPGAVVIGANAPRLPNTSCIALPGADAATLLIKLDLAGIAVSAGSACSSGKIGGSHVLAAMGIEARLARGTIRVSLGPTTTAAGIEHFLAAWREINRAGVRPSGSDTTDFARQSGASTRRRVKVSDPDGLTPAQAGE